jgi:hypothetical protein
MADVLENAIRDTGRVPNLVMSGHVHDYQRIEQVIAGKGTPTPFLVLGNGGYHNLHQIHTNVGTAAKDTGAVLKYAAVCWGYVTLSIDGETIRGVSAEIGRDGKPLPTKDQFEYTAKPLRLADGRQVKTL